MLTLNSRYNNEKGAVLVTGLVLLLILTLLGMSAMQSSTIEERMASNFEQGDLAFQASEAGLRDAEDWIGSQVAGGGLPSFTSGGTDGLWLPAAAGATPVWEVVDWTNTSTSTEYQDSDLDSTGVTKPRYVIEFVATLNSESDSLAIDEIPEELGMYRITSRGVSPNGRSEVWLQSTYLR